MADLVNQHAPEPQAQRFAAHLASASNSQKDFVIRAHNFARDAIKYKPDPAPFEQITGFPALCEQLAGDCDDKVIFLCTLLKARQIPCNFVAQSYDREKVARDGFDHVYCEAFVDGEWFGLDPTADGHNGQVQPAGWRQPLDYRGFEYRHCV